MYIKIDIHNTVTRILKHISILKHACTHIHTPSHKHTHTHTYMNMHAYSQPYTHKHTCIHTYTYINIHSYTQTYTHTLAYTHSHIHKHTHTHTHTNIRIHRHIHRHIHLHTYRVPRSGGSCPSSDLWTFDLLSKTWVQHEHCALARSFGTMVTLREAHKAQGELLIYGGMFNFTAYVSLFLLFSIYHNILIFNK